KERCIAARIIADLTGIGVSGIHWIGNTLRAKRTGHQQAELTRLDRSLRSVAFAVGRSYILVTCRKARACASIAKLDDSLAVVIGAGHKDTFTWPMPIERAHLVPFDVVDINLERRFYAA